MAKIKYTWLEKQGVLAAKGFSGGQGQGGIKNSRPEVALIVSQVPAQIAGVFTKNQVFAAPVALCRKRIKNNNSVRAIIVNSGNANACTGEQGDKDAETMAEITAQKLNIAPEEVLVCSTGVIGVPLPMKKVRKGIENASENLKQSTDLDLAQAIMTTDTFPKMVAVRVSTDGNEFTLGGMAKGAGMIHPDMATMLAFITTDFMLPKPELQSALSLAVEKTFNRITVDGDMSTNDTVLLMANGLASTGDEKNKGIFQSALLKVCEKLARMIAQDGEGASKEVIIKINGARTEAEAVQIGRWLGTSPLIKTAVYGNDANWGRIMARLGCSGIKINPEQVAISFSSIQVVKNGLATDYDETVATEALKTNPINITIDLYLGEASAEIYTCDFTEDYIKINAEYRT